MREMSAPVQLISLIVNIYTKTKSMIESASSTVTLFMLSEMLHKNDLSSQFFNICSEYNMHRDSRNWHEMYPLMIKKSAT